ncbi:uncharacterized protein LOC110720793 [Chenopodium quinoa]|uniref:uncharacterized protein LOC110720793 n=1 Tax=Chenopodium quinoa TaxID=63459 RepID=UPI000B781810|nr:uncharacterized protein LOC110720793 [Chenopodium quinoa]
MEMYHGCYNRCGLYVAVDTMKARWASYPAVITYGERTWLCHKIKFVTFWTNQVLHFGNTSNCRIESQHSAVKTWFESLIGSLDTVWARLHCHIVNQIIAICNSLEASRSKIGEKYRQLSLSRINGKVSQHCLKILDDETRRMRELSYQVYERCGCAMRVTHGLPCAFQIHDSLVAWSGLYIRQIHSFWKTLVIGDGVDIPVFVNDSTEEAAHFCSLVDKVIGSDPAILRNVSRIIEEELHPDHTNLEEPHVNHNVRGQRRNNDTRRDPCYFEHINRRNTQREDQCDISQCRYLHLLPRPMLPYITAWKDVIGDGNCGFRCVADFFFGDQAQWFTARETIANEVTAHPMLYERIYGIGRVWMNVECIRWDGGAVDMWHWMVAIQDLFPIATWFNARVICLGIGSVPTCYYPCITVLPLRARSTVRAPSREFVITTVGGSHFIGLDLAQDSPLPRLQVGGPSTTSQVVMDGISNMKS